MKKNSPSIQVEKIGGVCMSQMNVLLQNVFINLPNENLTRIFVISAYSGVTDLLLGNKEGTQEGVLQAFCKNNDWQQKMEILLSKLLEINRFMKKIGLPLQQADKFIVQYVDDLCNNLKKLTPFPDDSQNWLIKEYLSALGEVHSAYNCYEILRSKGLNAVFVNLADTSQSNLNSSLEKNVERVLQNISSDKHAIPVVTGYCWIPGGMVETYGRGYSEITFAKLVQMVKGTTSVIHKQFPICRIDPKFAFPTQKIEVLEHTTYQTLLSLQDTEMQAVHPEALKILSDNNLPLQVQSIHGESYGKTIISHKHFDKSKKMEIISGLKNCLYLQFCKKEEITGFLQTLKEIGVLPLCVQENSIVVKKIPAIDKLVKMHQNISVKKVSWIVGISSANGFAEIQKELPSITEEQQLQIFLAHIEEGQPCKIHLVVPPGEFYNAISCIHQYVFSTQPNTAVRV